MDFSDVELWHWALMGALTVSLVGLFILWFAVEAQSKGKKKKKK